MLSVWLVIVFVIVWLMFSSQPYGRAWRSVEVVRLLMGYGRIPQ